MSTLTYEEIAHLTTPEHSRGCYDCRAPHPSHFIQHHPHHARIKFFDPRHPPQPLMMPHGERSALGPAHSLCLEHRRDLMVALLSRHILRGLSIVRLRLLVRPLVKQQPHHRHVTAICSSIKSRPSIVVLCRDVRPELNQQPSHRLVPPTCSPKE